MVKDSSSELSFALVGGSDTIVAPATSSGRGALAIIRVSGPETRRLAERVLPKLDFSKPWLAQLVSARDREGEGLEKCVAIPYIAPQSYTGEDMIDVMVHGSSRLVDDLLELMTASGARIAEGGEFTRRAVANGKMDVVQAEAVRDLIAAESARQLENARRQGRGELSAIYQSLRNDIVSLWAEVEASLEFVAQGVTVAGDALEKRRERIESEIAKLLSTADAGELIRDGASVVIVGAPNSGKSTLFNALLRRNRAITSDLPGTTRDTVSAEVEIGGLRVTLVDTAGLRAAGDAIEQEGMSRTRAALGEARIAILLRPEGASDEGLEKELPAGLELVKVRSKADLASESIGPDEKWLPVSGLTGAGLEALRERIAKVLLAGFGESGVAIGRRHRECLEKAQSEVEQCDFEEYELAAERLRWAAAALAELIGEVDDEAVLDRIYAEFCVGK